MKRPKKRILLVDANEVRRDVRAYVMEIHGFAVETAEDVKAARACCERASFDVAVLVRKSPQAEQSLRFAEGPALLAIVADRVQARRSGANVVMLATDAPAEFLWRVKTLAARKRGPKKKPQATSVSNAERERVS